MNISEIKLKYDVPIEVSEKAFSIIMNQFSGTCTGRKNENGKYFIKPWLMSYRKDIKETIANNPIIK